MKIHNHSCFLWSDWHFWLGESQWSIRSLAASLIFCNVVCQLYVIYLKNRYTCMHVGPVCKCQSVCQDRSRVQPNLQGWTKLHSLVAAVSRHFHQALQHDAHFASILIRSISTSPAPVCNPSTCCPRYVGFLQKLLTYSHTHMLVASCKRLTFKTKTAYVRWLVWQAKLPAVVHPTKNPCILALVRYYHYSWNIQSDWKTAS